MRSFHRIADRDAELVRRGEMPPINLTAEQIADVAAYIHSFRVGGYDVSRMVPPSILVGDATEAASIIPMNSSSDFVGVALNFVAMVRLVIWSTSYTAVKSADGISAYNRAWLLPI